MAKLGEGFGLDLPDPFTRQREVSTDLFEGVIRLFADAKPHPQDFLLTLCQSREDALSVFRQIHVDGLVTGRRRVIIFEKILKTRVFLVTHWGFKTDRCSRKFQRSTNVFDRNIEFFSYFFGSRFSADSLFQ